MPEVKDEKGFDWLAESLFELPNEDAPNVPELELGVGAAPNVPKLELGAGAEPNDDNPDALELCPPLKKDPELESEPNRLRGSAFRL